MPKLSVVNDELTIEEEDNSIATALIKGAKGKLTIRGREINKVKDSKGKVLKDTKNPKNVGKVEKKKEK